MKAVRVISIVLEILWCVVMIPGMVFALMMAEMSPEALIGYKGGWDAFRIATTMMRWVGWLLFLSLPVAAIAPFRLRRKGRLAMSLWVQTLPLIWLFLFDLLNTWQWYSWP
ncbi:MAG: hypothetical protein GX558_07370 [Clostridiales bacterium]|nr:hypothetical protein [Clostridiales bacterium]